MIKELLTILESKQDVEKLVAELMPRGSRVYEYEVIPDFIDITVDHDLPEHALTVGAIKSKFGSLVSKLAVHTDRDAPSTARHYHVTLKTSLTQDQVNKISKVLEKATKWRKA